MALSSQIKHCSVEIELAAPSGWTYAPGDPIIGSVIRRDPIATPEANVKVAFKGFMNIKIHIKEGIHRGETNRRQWSLGDVQCHLSHGPLHLPEGEDKGLSWPFELDIPRRPGPNIPKSYFPTERLAQWDADGLSQQILPPSFFSCSGGWDRDVECYIVYHLEAEIRYMHGGKFTTRTVTVPIKIRHPPASTRLTNFQIQKWKSTQWFQSRRLVPEMERKHLTFKEKTQRLFTQPNDPHFSYNVHVGLPTVIQLNSRSPIPLTIKISPEPERTSVEIRDIPRTVRLNWIKAVVYSTTNITSSRDSNFRVKYDTHTIQHDLQLQDFFAVLERPIVFPVEHGNEPVNIGEMLYLVLEPNYLKILGQRKKFGRTIFPDFVTFNMAHSHGISWKLSLTVAGKTQNVDVNTRLKILPEC